MTVDKVTISSKFGEDLTVEEYEEKERGDLLEQEIKELYPRISGEFVRTIRRGHKAKWHDPITKALSSRYHSPEEIERRNEEMASKTAIVRKQVILNMLLNAGDWVLPGVYLEDTGLDPNSASCRGTLSSAVSQIFPFLEATGNMKRRDAPQGRGYVYLYDKDAAVDPEGMIDRIFEDYQEYERAKMQTKRIMARGEDPPPPTKTGSEPGDPVRDPPKAPIPIVGQIEELLTLTQNGSGLNVKVDFNVNIRFGLIKE